MFTRSGKTPAKYNDENGVGRRDLIFDDGRKYYVMGENDDLLNLSEMPKPHPA